MAETILVVDDEAQIRNTLRGVLSDEGFDVLEAENGRAALEVLAHRKPRLAIVDIWMPEVDGIELVQRMRTQAPRVPIIVISGHGTIETAVRVIRDGAFDCSAWLAGRSTSACRTGRQSRSAGRPPCRMRCRRAASRSARSGAAWW